MKLSLLKLLTLPSLALFAFAAFAQVGLPSASLSIKITPEFPDPKANIVANLISYSTDLNRASIIWTLDGKILSQGTGLKEISFQAAAHGSENTLSATVITPEGETFAATVSVSPQAVDLFIEAKSIIPNWYKGAALPSGSSRVVVTAVPDFRSGGSKLNATSLNYEWRIDGRVSQEVSGRGKRTITLAAPGPGEVPKDIELKVSSSDGLIAKEAFASVRAFPAEVLFYERRGMEGIFAQALKTKTIKAGSGFEAEAAPFFMNASNKNLQFEWRMNNNKVDAKAGSPRILEINALAGSEGQQVSIETLITNLINIYEKAGNIFNVKVE